MSALGLTWAIVGARSDAARASGAMPQAMYVWQRAWGAGVRESVSRHGPGSAGLIALAAEIAWETGRPVLARAPVDHALLSRTGTPVGLAVRIGPYPGPFHGDDATAVFLAGVAGRVVSEARAAGCEPAELQIDFDCATSKLGGYREWVRAIAAAVAPTPVSITALPAWMTSWDFAPLAREAGGFVLQGPLALSDGAAWRRLGGWGWPPRRRSCWPAGRSSLTGCSCRGTPPC